MKIHPTSVVSPEIQIAEDVEIGPYCLIQGKGKIGKGTFVEGHVTLGYKHGIIEIGENNHFSPGAVIGGPPQDVSYKNEETSLIIGNNNTFREFSTVNLPTSKGTKKTIIGNNCYIMAYAHVGHDCHLGNNVIMANNSGLAGHCEIEDNVVISAMCGISQFTRIGRGSFIGGGSVINKDIPPFVRAEGHWAVVRATNKIGLIRRGVSREEANNIHKAVRILVMGKGTIDENIERIRAECKTSENLEHFIHFVKSSKKGIAISRGQKEVADD